MKRPLKQNRPEPVRRSGRAPSKRRQAWRLLVSLHTHAFISPAVAHPILAGFGLGDIRTERVRANVHDDPKGLKTDDGRHRTIEGFSVYSLSTRIADSLPDLPEGTEVSSYYVTQADGERDYHTKLGRGSAAQAAWQYINAALKLEGE